MHAQRVVPAVAAILFLALPAAARESFLAASDWEAPPGQEVRITEHSGTGFAGESLAFRRGRVTRLLVRDATERNLASEPRDGDPDLARLLVADDDGILVGLETAPVTVKMSAAELDWQVEEFGLRGMAATRSRSAFARGGLERQFTVQKLWLNGDDGRRVRRPLGLPLELVPNRNPSEVSRARFQLLYKGRAVSGAVVSAWTQPFLEDGTPAPADARLDLPRRQLAITNERGLVRLDLSRHGEYLVSAAHAVPCRDVNAGDWDAWWTSMTFARGPHRVARSSEPRTLRGTGVWTNPDLGLPPHDRSRTRRDVPGWGRDSR